MRPLTRYYINIRIIGLLLCGGFMTTLYIITYRSSIDAESLSAQKKPEKHVISKKPTFSIYNDVVVPLFPALKS